MIGPASSTFQARALIFFLPVVIACFRVLKIPWTFLAT